MRVLTEIVVAVLLVQSAVAQAPTAKPSDNRMVLIHGGTITMGIDESEIPRFVQLFHITHPDLFHDLMPKHTVAVSDFWIDKYLVTNREFKAFVDANAAWRPGRLPHELDNGNYLTHWITSNAPGIAEHPVVNVNWYAAVAYCHWAGKRLPTEAEWEYAARGGSNVLFPWGDEPVDKTRANSTASGIGTTTPVGTYPPNRYGLFDMAGNVWQFTADEWIRYAAVSQTNPVAGGDRFTDPNSFLNVRTRRVIRGGSFAGVPVNLWVEYRDSHPPNGSREFVGFRCAK